MGALTPRPTRRKLIFTASALTVALVLASCGGGSLSSGDSSSGNDSATSVKIGLLVPTSGVYAPLGEDMTQGFELYLKQHDNKLGGYDVDLVKADEGEEPSTAVPAATRLVQKEKVAAVTGVVNSASALGMANVFDSAKVPLIISNAGAGDLTGSKGSEFIWRTSFSNSQPSYAIGKYVAEQVGDAGAYILAADYAAGREDAAAFKRAFEAAGGKVVGEQFTPFPSTKDFQPYLSKVKASGAKGVFVFYAGSAAVTFVKQYASFGLKKSVSLYAPGFLTEGGVLTAQGDAAQGVVTALHYADGLDNPKNKEFVDAYTKAYSKPPTVYAVQSYDAAAVLDKALDKAGSADGKAISTGLSKIDEVDSPRGTWRFDEGHNPVQSFYLRKVEKSGDNYINKVIKDLGKIDQATAEGRG